jgi:hypothetical protein
MDPSTLSAGEKIAGVSALVLILSMFILGWFSIDGISTEVEGAGGLGNIEISGDDLGSLAEQSGEDTSGNAWEAFGLIDLVLLVTVLAAVGVAVARATGNSVPSEAAMVVMGLGALSVLLLLFRVIVPPDLVPGDLPDGVEVDVDVSRGIGLFVGLIASAGIAYGGMLMQGDEPARPSSRPAAAPPPPPAADAPPPTSDAPPAADAPPPTSDAPPPSQPPQH